MKQHYNQIPTTMRHAFEQFMEKNSTVRTKITGKIFRALKSNAGKDSRK